MNEYTLSIKSGLGLNLTEKYKISSMRNPSEMKEELDRLKKLAEDYCEITRENTEETFIFLLRLSFDIKQEEEKDDFYFQFED